jgi:hypothetical protein
MRGLCRAQNTEGLGGFKFVHKGVKQTQTNVIK